MLTHSYENCRGVPNSSHYGTEHPTSMRVLPALSAAEASERRESKDLSLHPVRMPSRGRCAYQESITYEPPRSLFRQSRVTNHQSPTNFFFSRSSALFCTPEIHNCFPFNRFRTLCQNHPGVGSVGQTSVCPPQLSTFDCRPLPHQPPGWSSRANYLHTEDLK